MEQNWFEKTKKNIQENAKEVDKKLIKFDGTLKTAIKILNYIGLDTIKIVTWYDRCSAGIALAREFNDELQYYHIFIGDIVYVNSKGELYIFDGR